MRGLAWIKRGVAAAATLMAAFAGYLHNVAPPDGLTGDSSTAVGIASCGIVIVTLVLASLPEGAWQGRRRGAWIAIGAASGVGFILVILQYHARYRELVFAYPADAPARATRYVRGTTLTPPAESYVASRPGLSAAELLAAFGGVGRIERVWVRETVSSAEQKLLYWYIGAVALLAFSLFSLAELIQWHTPLKDP